MALHENRHSSFGLRMPSQARSRSRRRLKGARRPGATDTPERSGDRSCQHGECWRGVSGRLVLPDLRAEHTPLVLHLGTCLARSHRATATDRTCDLGSAQRKTLRVRRLELIEQPLGHLHAWFVFGALAQPKRLPERLPRVLDATHANTRRRIQRPQPRTLPTSVAGLAQRQHGLTVVAASTMTARSSRQSLVMRLFVRRAGARFDTRLSQSSCHESLGTTLGWSESCATKRKFTPARWNDCDRPRIGV